MSQKNIDLVYLTKAVEWRAWLTKNHQTKSAVWLLFQKKNSPKPSLSWNDAIDEALCFGWVDSKKQSVDEHSYKLFFSKRKADSTWSKINKDKIQRLQANDKLMPAGLESVKVAKENGAWNILDDVENLIVPNDLNIAFQSKPGSKDFYVNLSNSKKKGILQWIVLAKKKETRNKRVAKTVDLAAQSLLPKHLR